VLRFLPPYIITKKEIGKFIKALDKIFAEVAKERAEGSPFAAEAEGH
jgi:acetylornithine/succinyldiaminopimelate/putrescine aminotransferase